MGQDAAPLTEGRRALDLVLQQPHLTDRTRVAALVAANWEASLAAASSTPSQSGVSREEAVEAVTTSAWALLQQLRSVSGDKIAALSLDNASDDDVAPPHSPPPKASSKGPAPPRSRDWKLKDDTGVYRVLYRPGPEGTPLHELCLEGIIDGPLPTALCVLWEAPHFKDWWPQSNVPPFKIQDSRYLKRMTPGADAGYVKFKVPWPFAPRDMAFMSWALTDAPSGLLVGSVRSVPEGGGEFGPEWRGVKRSDIPVAGHSSVRINVSGGYALREISPTKCYMRGISLIDMKLDFVPAWLINFMSRQLAGRGFGLFNAAVVDAWKGSTKAGKIFRSLTEREPLYQEVSAQLESRREAGGGLPPLSQVRAAPPSAPSSGNLSDSVPGSRRQEGRTSRSAASTGVPASSTASPRSHEAGSSQGPRSGPLAAAAEPLQRVGDTGGHALLPVEKADSAGQPGGRGTAAQQLSQEAAAQLTRRGKLPDIESVPSDVGQSSQGRGVAGRGQIGMESSVSASGYRQQIGGESESTERRHRDGEDVSRVQSSEDYDGLQFRDPELFEAVQTIDKLIAMLSARAASK